MRHATPFRCGFVARVTVVVPARELEIPRTFSLPAASERSAAFVPIRFAATLAAVGAPRVARETRERPLIAASRAALHRDRLRCVPPHNKHCDVEQSVAQFGHNVSEVTLRIGEPLLQMTVSTHPGGGSFESGTEDSQSGPSHIQVVKPFMPTVEMRIANCA